MPFYIDAAVKGMVGIQTPDFAAYFQVAPDRPLSLLNVDVSTITAATDAVIGLGNPLEEIVDINFQAGPDSDLEYRVLLYSALLRFREGVPVRSVLVLLHPKADHSRLTGKLSYASGKSRLEF